MLQEPEEQQEEAEWQDRAHSALCLQLQPQHQPGSILARVKHLLQSLPSNAFTNAFHRLLWEVSCIINNFLEQFHMG